MTTSMATAEDTVDARQLAAELNVSVRMIRDFVRAGHLTESAGQITRESANELRWRLAFAVAGQATAGGGAV